MSEVSIVTGGSRGDVQPYIALGKGLKEAGYKVRLLSSEDFETLAMDADLDFRSTGESVEVILQSDEWRKTMENGNFLSILSRMQKEMKKRSESMARQLPELLEGSDLIVTGIGGMGGAFSVAEMLKIPVVQAYVFPFTPTNEFAAPIVPRLPIGGVFNRPSFHVMRQMLWQSVRAGDAATRHILGLGKGRITGPYRALNQSQVPALYGFSQHVIPRPHDWPANHQVTGYWFLDEPEQWTPPHDLEEFLGAGETPVYIGFGSMRSGNPEDVAAIILEALRLSGQRGIMASGWGGLKPSDVPDTIHLIESIPHSWLFPRVAVVIHHGGAGTTAAGLRAGVPAIVVPFMGDQVFWGQRVADLGVGTAPIPKKRLTVAVLGAAITEAVSNSTMHEQATALGEKIRAENGISNAVAFVNRFVQGGFQPTT